MFDTQKKIQTKAMLAGIYGECLLSRPHRKHLKALQNARLFLMCPRGRNANKTNLTNGRNRLVPSG